MPNSRAEPELAFQAGTLSRAVEANAAPGIASVSEAMADSGIVEMWPIP